MKHLLPLEDHDGGLLKGSKVQAASNDSIEAHMVGRRLPVALPLLKESLLQPYRLAAYIKMQVNI